MMPIMPMRDQKATIAAVVMGMGALLLGVFFMLPWLDVGLGIRAAGFDMARLEIYLYLLLLVVVLGLVWAIYIGYRGTCDSVSALAAGGLVVFALLPIAIFALRLQTVFGGMGLSGVPNTFQMLSYGFWGAVIALIVMLVGALVAVAAMQQAGPPVAMYPVGPTIPPTMPPMPPPPPPTRPVTSLSPHGSPEPSRPLKKTDVTGVPSAAVGWLVVQGGPRHGKQFGLKAGDNTVGRDGSRCDVVLEDSSVSGEHARVRYENGQFWVYDMASTNGTFVNNRQVQKQMLYDGDVIRAGEVALVFKMVSRR